MMAYVNHDYYLNDWLGELEVSNFEQLAERASDYIDTITFHRLKKDSSLVCDEVKKATCSVIEEMHRQNETRTKGVVKSFSNDGYSETMTYGSDLRSNARKLREAASLYLANTGLLYRGVRYENG